MEIRIQRALFSLLYCGAMSGQPNLLYLWVLAGTPLTLSKETLVGAAPVLAGILGGRALELLSAFVCGLVSGCVASLTAQEESTATPAAESNPDLRR